MGEKDSIVSAKGGATTIRRYRSPFSKVIFALHGLSVQLKIGKWRKQEGFWDILAVSAQHPHRRLRLRRPLPAVTTSSTSVPPSKFASEEEEGGEEEELAISLWALENSTPLISLPLCLDFERKKTGKMVPLLLRLLSSHSENSLPFFFLLPSPLLRSGAH